MIMSAVKVGLRWTMGSIMLQDLTASRCCSVSDWGLDHLPVWCARRHCDYNNGGIKVVQSNAYAFIGKNVYIYSL